MLEQPDKLTTWTKVSKDKYRGLGCTIHNGDTIFKEELKLFNLEKEWVLEVSGVNESPTPFHLINHTENGFISENETNEFPKKIEYKRQNDSLLANISDDSTEITFNFIKPENR